MYMFPQDVPNMSPQGVPTYLTCPPKVYPTKYCSLLRSEGGIPVLVRLTTTPRPSHVKKLAQTVLSHCRIYEVGRRFILFYTGFFKKDMFIEPWTVA